HTSVSHFPGHATPYYGCIRQPTGLYEAARRHLYGKEEYNHPNISLGLHLANIPLPTWEYERFYSCTASLLRTLRLCCRAFPVNRQPGLRMDRTDHESPSSPPCALH